MNQQTRSVPSCQSLAVQKYANLLPVAQAIDEKAQTACEIFKGNGSFQQALALAQAVNDIRELLTPEAMAPVMALMNTPLGFKTDRDPKVTPGTTPYSLEIVRECFIESKLRGFEPIGNEWNIISGQFYSCKNGLRRQVTGGKHFADVSDFKDFYEVPRTVQGGAVVKCKATWRRNGHEDSIECEIPVKTNNYTGTDAILGKAERKLLKRVHDRLSGKAMPEGEVEEIDITARATCQPVSSPDFGKAPEPAHAPVVESAPPPAAAPAPAARHDVVPTAQHLLGVMLSEAGFDLELLVKWCLKDGWLKDPAEARNWKSFDDMPAALANRLLNAKTGLLGWLKATKGGAK